MPSSRSHIASSHTENTLPSVSTRNINFKTPARSPKRGKTVHNENSVYGHPRTAGFTGRQKNSVLFNTPAVNEPLRSGFKTDKVPRFASKSTALIEITNRTPFAKSLVPVTPAASLKPSKSFVIFNDDSVVPSTRRISSTRKKLRLPRSASKKFETPETKGNYWDVSDASIEGSVIEDASIMEEDYDDVEYTPPTAIDPKYDPGFDMPDYKNVGATLMSLFRQTAIFDDCDPTLDCEGADLLEDIGPVVWEKLELPDILPDDIFPFMNQSESVQTSTAGAHVLKVGSSHSKSTEARSVMPSKSGPLRQTVTKQPSKALTSKMTHTRIPSLSKPRVSQETMQAIRPMSNFKPTSSGHSRILNVPSRSTNVTHTKKNNIPSKSIGTICSKTTNMSRTNGGYKPVGRCVSSTERRPRMKQLEVPDDTVLSLLTDSGNEPLGGEFLFTV